MENIMNVYESALGYLESYYGTFADENFNFGFSLCKRLSHECGKIAKSEKIKGFDMGNAILACTFRYAGVTNIMVQEDTKIKLLDDFTRQMSYPEEEVACVRELINRHSERQPPATKLERVVWDALDYRLAMDDLFLNILHLKEEMNRLNENHYDEMAVLNELHEEFSGDHCFTDYAKKNYAEELARNKSKIVKRIQRLSSTEPVKKSTTSGMTDRETEDLFKIAFRNYVKLVDVADSKAGLLIHVNSILISVVIGFAVSRTEKYPMLVIPFFLILTIAFLTILLAILASRPQRNSYIQDKSSKSYQTFFFGSFDLIGSEFRDADFDTYSAELDSFLKGGKDQVYAEIYKEVFNVRKVLSKKFTFLSYAYMVFLSGLAISIIAFFIAIR
jgi:hypothetical protein